MVKRLVLSLAFVCLSFVAVDAAVDTTTVQGKVYMPDGTTATSGTITARLSDAATADDGGTAQRVAGRVDGTVGADGTITLALTANDIMTPNDTYYEVSFSIRAPVQASWTEKWNVTASPDPVDVGSVTRLEFAPGITVGNYMLYVSAEPSGACVATEAPRFDIAGQSVCQCSSLVWSCESILESLSQTFTDPDGDACTSGTSKAFAYNDGSSLLYYFCSTSNVYEVVSAGVGDMLQVAYDSTDSGFVDGLDGGAFADIPGSPGLNFVYLVTDDASSGDCAGGGTENTLCVWTGSAWEAFGGTGGGGGGSGYASVATDSGTVTEAGSDGLSIVGGDGLTTTGATGTPDEVTADFNFTTLAPVSSIAAADYFVFWNTVSDTHERINVNNLLTTANMQFDPIEESELSNETLLWTQVGTGGTKTSSTFWNGGNNFSQVPWATGISGIPDGFSDGFDADTFGSVSMSALRSVRRNGANDGYEAYLPGDRGEANTWTLLQTFGAGITLGDGTDKDLIVTFNTLTLPATMTYDHDHASGARFVLSQPLEVSTLYTTAIEVEQHATDGQCIVVKEGADTGTGSVAWCVGDAINLADSQVTWEIDALGRLEDGAIGDGSDAGAGVSGTMTTIKEGDIQVGDADIVTLDFLDADFDLTESPNAEMQVVISADIARQADLHTLFAPTADPITDHPDLLTSLIEDGGNELKPEVMGTLCAVGEIIKSNGTGGFDCDTDLGGAEINSLEAEITTGILADELLIGVTGGDTAAYKKISVLADEATPDSGDLLLVEDSSTGALMKIDVVNWPNDLEAVAASAADNEVFVGTGVDGGLYKAFPISQVPIFNGDDFVSSFVLFSGPASSTKTFTLPDASAKILTNNAVVTHEEGGLEADVSAYNGLIRIASGTTTNVTNLSGLNTAIGSGLVTGAHTTSASDLSTGTLADARLPAAMAGKALTTSTTTTEAATDSDTSIASTAFVKLIKEVEPIILYDVDGLADTADIADVFRAPAAITIIEVWCSADDATGSTITLEDGGGVDLTTACVCDTTPVACTLTANVAYTDGELMDFVMVSAGVSNRVSVMVEYTYD